MIADAAKNSTDQVQFNADAAATLGRGFGVLVPMMKEGAAGLREIGEEAQRGGLILTNEMTAKLDAMGDAWDRLKVKSQVSFAPALLSFANGIMTLGKAIAVQFEMIGAVAAGNLEAAKNAFLEFEKSITTEPPIAPKAGAGGEGGEERGADAAIRAKQDESVMKEATAEAKRQIDLLAEASKLREQNDFARLDAEQKLEALKDKQFETEIAIMELSDPTAKLEMEVERLKIVSKIQSLEQSIAKDAADKADKVADKLSDEAKTRADFLAQEAKIKTGEGISVSAPITDSLARIGGFVGATGDNRARMAEQQLAVQEKLLENLDKLVARIAPNFGATEDIVASL